MSAMSTGLEFSLISIEKKLYVDTETFDYADVDYEWQSLTFKEIERVSWSPKIEVGKRYNILKPLDVEILGGFSILNIDRKVQEVNTRFIYDNNIGDLTWDYRLTDVNYAAFRTTYVPIQLGVNLYFNALSKDAFDLRVYGGGAINWFALVTPGPSSEFGVNGKGNDIYRTAEDLLFYGGYDANGIYNVENTFYSEYYGKVNIEAPAREYLDQTIRNAQTLRDYSRNDWEQILLYPTVNFGFEFEFNRFLAGASGEFTVIGVDNFLVRDYYNINLNLGYIIQSNNKINKKLQD
jgi:hypothetical protein